MRVVADLRAELAHLLMRAPQKIIEDAELVHDFERRGVNRVAAEVAQEVGVLFEDQDVDAGPGQQKSKHHPGGPAADDAAARGQDLRH